jgi:hypothetical protein
LKSRPNRIAWAHHNRKIIFKQLDDGIGDTLVSIQSSLVVRRQLLSCVAFGLIVVDPELRIFLRHDCRYLGHGLERGLLVPAIARDISM